MNSIGNKIVAALCLISSLAFAEEIELTTFSASTPAKAEEVNGNFETLKSQLEALKIQLSKLKKNIPSEPEYSVPVYSEGNLIGHTQPLPAYNVPPEIKLITSNELYKFHEIVNESNVYIRSDINHIFGNISLVKDQAVTIGITGAYLDSKCTTQPVIASVLSADRFAYNPNYQISQDIYFIDEHQNYFKASAGSKPVIANKVYVSSVIAGNPNPEAPECSTIEFTNEVVFFLQSIDKSEIAKEFSSITIEGYQPL